MHPKSLPWPSIKWLTFPAVGKKGSLGPLQEIGKFDLLKALGTNNTKALKVWESSRACTPCCILTANEK